MEAQQPRNRLVYLGLLTIVIVLGLGSRKFAASLPPFIAENAGDALWTVAAFVSLAILFPRWSSIQLGSTSLLISFAVEFSQLLDVSWLNAIRNNKIGRLFLGSGFLWADLIRYLFGAASATVLDAGRKLSLQQHADDSLADR